MQHAVRQGDWKYLRVDTRQARAKRPDTGEFLFNVATDPRETTNLAAANPDVLDRLRRLYAEWHAGVLPPIEPMTRPPAATTTTR